MNSSPSSTTSGGTGFSIRWGRLTIFAVGAIALVVAFICAIAGLFGAATWLTAGISVLITAASYGALRGLAVMDSKNRSRERERLSRSAGFESTIATYEPAVPRQDSTPVYTDDEVFDVAGDQPAAPQPEATETPAEDEPVQQAPAPVPARKPLPRPMYLDAPEVTREVPEPMETPQDPAPSRQVQLSEGVSSQYQDKISEKANTRLDLDKVLNRRRAI